MATLTLKVIKSKTFKVDKVDYIAYTCAYKGRVFGLSTLQWSEDVDSIVVEDNKLTISTDVEVKKTISSTDPLTGEVTPSYLNIVPKLGLVLADM